MGTTAKALTAGRLAGSALMAVAVFGLAGCASGAGGTPSAAPASAPVVVSHSSSAVDRPSDPATAPPTVPPTDPPTDSSTDPATDPPGGIPVADQPDPASADQPDPTSADQPEESMIWVPAGDHRVPGTLALPADAAGPADPAAGPVPVVLLLHGDFSSRDENGDLFGRLAADLAARGIASLRIDFAGSGDSEEPSLDLDYPNMVADASAAVDYLQADPRFDANEIAVLGLSRGGSIAATLAGTVPGLAALVEWSGAVYDGYDELPDLHDQARADGYATIGTNDSEFQLSLNWFDSIEQSHPLDDVADYTGPILAIVGSDDDVVPPETAQIMLDNVASTDTTLHTIAGADHEYGATSDDQTEAEEALSVTGDWLASRLFR